jgi:hypothetical protein
MVENVPPAEKKGVPSPSEIRSRREEAQVREQAYRKDPTEERRPAPTLPDNYRGESERKPEESKPAQNTVRFSDLVNDSRRNDRYGQSGRYDDRRENRYDRRDEREDRGERNFRDIAYGRKSGDNSLDPYATDGRREDRGSFDPRRDERYSGRSDSRRDDRFDRRRGGPGF